MYCLFRQHVIQFCIPQTTLYPSLSTHSPSSHIPHQTFSIFTFKSGSTIQPKGITTTSLIQQLCPPRRQLPNQQVLKMRESHAFCFKAFIHFLAIFDDDIGQFKFGLFFRMNFFMTLFYLYKVN